MRFALLAALVACGTQAPAEPVSTPESPAPEGLQLPEKPEAEAGSPEVDDGVVRYALRGMQPEGRVEAALAAVGAQGK